MHLSFLRPAARKIHATLIPAFAVTFLNTQTCATWAQSPVPHAGPSTEPLMPVVTAYATVHDVPIYLTSIGTTVASNTAVVRSKVQGKLTTIDFTAGQQVQAGDILARVDARSYQARLDRNISIRDRDQALLGDTVATLNLDPGSTSAAKPSSNLLDTQTKIHRLTEIIRNDDARVAQDRIELGTTELLSPTSGVAGKPLHHKGDVIAPTDKTGLVVIGQIEPISVVFKLPEVISREIQERLANDHVGVRLYGVDKVHPLAEGRLVHNYDETPRRKSGGELEASFPNKDHTLLPGMHVEVLVRGSAKRTALTIPLAAIQQSSAGYYAYIVTESQTAHVRPVTLGTITDGVAVVRDGLLPGDVVIIDGQDQLTEGSRVAIVAGPTPDRHQNAAATE